VKLKTPTRHYMKQAEFAARQAWLDFEDAVGTALEAIAPAMTEARKWFKEFIKTFKTKAPQPVGPIQLQLYEGITS
jgi:hypothetical protein